MDKILETTLLYDFYGELLTERQKQMFEMYYLDDFSLSEIGEQLDVSRQAVRDSLKHSKQALEEYEDKLGLVDKFSKQKSSVAKMLEIVDNIEKATQFSDEIIVKFKDIRALADEILDL